jgi:hypothetical protein
VELGIPGMVGYLAAKEAMEKDETGDSWDWIKIRTFLGSAKLYWGNEQKREQECGPLAKIAWILWSEFMVLPGFIKEVRDRDIIKG